MALTIDLDDAPPGTVAGTVFYTAEKNVTPNAVTVELAWGTRGRGTDASGPLATGSHDPGPLAAGETVRVPFRCELPAGCVRPFAGELIQLFYAVKARADLPWAFDETAERDVPVG